MTQVAAVAPGDRWLYLYVLVNPASGSHNVVISASTTTWILAGAADYSGASQTGVPDNSTTETVGVTNSISKALTPSASDCWIIFVAGGYIGGGQMTSSNGSTTVRQSDGTLGTWALADTNAAVNGSTTMGLQYVSNSNGINGIVASFAPVAAAPASPRHRTVTF
jgi:hypothetical protein